MSNSDKAMKELEKLADYYGNDVEDWEIGIYIKQQEQLQAENETLKRDVARYFELKQGIPPLEDEMNYQFAQKYRLEYEPKDECYFRISNEYYQLEEKLSKVGKE